MLLTSYIHPSKVYLLDEPVLSISAAVLQLLYLFVAPVYQIVKTARQCLYVWVPAGL